MSNARGCRRAETRSAYCAQDSVFVNLVSIADIDMASASVLKHAKPQARDSSCVRSKKGIDVLGFFAKDLLSGSIVLVVFKYLSVYGIIV